MPKSLVGFAQQSIYVGVGLMCKQFTDKWYTTKHKEEDISDYGRTVVPTMTPEKSTVNKLFSLLETHVFDDKRTKFDKTYVSSVKKNLSTDLKHTVLENSTKEGPKTSADRMSLTLSDVYQQSIDDQAVNESEELDEANMAEVDSEKNSPTPVRTTSYSKKGKDN